MIVGAVNCIQQADGLNGGVLFVPHSCLLAAVGFA